MKNLLSILLITLSFASQCWANDLNPLVLIETTSSVGSGFIIKDDGKFYVITNLHVLVAGKPRIRLLNGTEVTVGKLEISAHRDLARISTSNEELTGFSAEERIPIVGETIRVLGNSDGAAVVTELKGKILGVGPELIEVDAKFIQGNSGSPILSEDGLVLGVASFANKNVDIKNWVKEGTRFNKVRRFGYRLAGVKWNEMSWEGLSQREALLQDMELLCYDLFRLKYTEQLRSEDGFLLYDYRKENSKYLNFKMFAESLSRISTEINFLSKIYGEENDFIKNAMELTNSARNISGQGMTNEDNFERRNYERGQRARRHNKTIHSLNKILFEDHDIFLRSTSVQVLGRDVKSRMNHDKWGSKYLSDRADYLYRLFISISNGDILKH